MHATRPISFHLNINMLHCATGSRRLFVRCIDRSVCSSLLRSFVLSATQLSPSLSPPFPSSSSPLCSFFFYIANLACNSGGNGRRWLARLMVMSISCGDEQESALLLSLSVLFRSVYFSFFFFVLFSTSSFHRSMRAVYVCAWFSLRTLRIRDKEKEKHREKGERDVPLSIID